MMKLNIQKFAFKGSTFTGEFLASIIHANVQNKNISDTGVFPNYLSEFSYALNSNIITINSGLFMNQGRTSSVDLSVDLIINLPANGTDFGYVIWEYALNNTIGNQATLKLKQQNDSFPDLINDDLFLNTNGLSEIALYSYEATNAGVTNVQDLRSF